MSYATKYEDHSIMSIEGRNTSVSKVYRRLESRVISSKSSGVEVGLELRIVR